MPPHNCGYQELRNALLPHRQCLETLTIGILYDIDDDTVLNVSDFTALEKLDLSEFRFDGTPYETCNQVFSAPKLTHFTWTFPREQDEDGDDLGHGIDYFGRAEMRWLLGVARIVQERRYSLRSIFLWV
jgi:hypothetical protein